MDKDYLKRRRQQRREQFKQLLGGRCINCGRTSNLQFDHKDPSKKEFRISIMIDSPEQRLLDELKKCQLLCADCHKKKTLEKQEFGIESSHGTIWRYKKYKCRCDKCRQAMSEYNRNLRKRQLKSMSGVEFDPNSGHFEYHNPTELDYYHPHPAEINPELLKKIKVKLLGKLGGMEIWAVNGDLVREVDPDFTTGGNPFRYTYVPEGELWIEMTSSPNETIITSAHERIESKFMEEEKLDYENAHDATVVYDITIRRAIDDGYLKAKTQEEAIKLADGILQNLNLI
jgi:hypothetical protein